MQAAVLGVLILIMVLVPVHRAAAPLKRTEFLHRLLEGYDSRVPPNFDTNKATVVVCDILIGSFDSISENTMDYVLSIFLRQRWEDERLNFTHLADDEEIMMDARMADSIWIPDLFFTNEKRAYFHDVMIPNKFIRIYKNGTIYYSARISLTLSCPMKLHKFPMDRQICSIQMESYAYTMDRLRFVWKEHNPVEVAEALELPQFKLKDIILKDCSKSYNTGTFTCLQVEFLLNRDLGYYMIQTYIPSGLVVILSWVSFWINVDAIPARISLGVLTILTITTQSSGVRQSLPRVSYIKAIDVWMSTCLLFVFAALLEFAIVNVHSRKEVRRLATIKRKRKNQQQEELADMTDSMGEGSPANGATAFTHVFREEWGRRGARDCDKYSRRIFPAVFVLFNGVYWATYFFWEQI